MSPDFESMWRIPFPSVISGPHHQLRPRRDQLMRLENSWTYVSDDEAGLRLKSFWSTGKVMGRRSGVGSLSTISRKALSRTITWNFLMLLAPSRSSPTSVDRDG